jgi:hypothetical protein
MILPPELADVLTAEEIKTLVRFYGTDFYTPYLDCLKEKYYRLYEFFGEDE